MTEPKSKLDELLERLARERADIALKIHLGKAEARKEWENLERRFTELKHRAEPIRHEAGRTADGVGAALRQAVDEIGRGYRRIRKML